MSSDEPGIPPLPPPPLPEPAAWGAAPIDALPWERRSELGFLNAFVETVRLFVASPSEAWRRTREKGDYAEPLIFAILVSWIGVAVSAVWTGFLGNPFLAFLPPEMKEKVGSAMAANVGMLLIQVGLAPVFVVVWLFLGAAIYHVSFLMVGATKDSASGFEGTFRTVSYSSVSQLANLVPFVGWLVALVWSPVLMVMGAVRMHRTTQGRAIAGILIPLAVCCVCLVVAAGLLVGGVLALLRHS